MPPTEALGKQILLVDSSGQQLDTLSYLKQPKSAALARQIFNPEIGFALVGNTGAGQKYPYDPFYGRSAPDCRLNPNYQTESWARCSALARAHPWRLQPSLWTSEWRGPCPRATAGYRPDSSGSMSPELMPAAPGAAPRLRTDQSHCRQCFPRGTDGNNAPIPPASQTLPQPTIPGVNSVGGAGEALDPHFRPNVVDSFDFTIQRQLTNRCCWKWATLAAELLTISAHQH